MWRRCQTKRAGRIHRIGVASTEGLEMRVTRFRSRGEQACLGTCGVVSFAWEGEVARVKPENSGRPRKAASKNWMGDGPDYNSELVRDLIGIWRRGLAPFATHVSETSPSSGRVPRTVSPPRGPRPLDLGIPRRPGWRLSYTQHKHRQPTESLGPRDHRA